VLGQYINYRTALKILYPEHRLHLAVPLDAFETFFQRKFVQLRQRRRSFMTEAEKIQVILDILGEIAVPGIPREIEYHVVTDTTNHHYQVLVSGWVGMKRTFGIAVHIHVKNGLVWSRKTTRITAWLKKWCAVALGKRKLSWHFMRPTSALTLGMRLDSHKPHSPRLEHGHFAILLA
jgi:hypothetical protein